MACNGINDIKVFRKGDKYAKKDSAAQESNSISFVVECFVRDEIDIDLLENLLSLGGLGIQYCIKSQKAYLQMKINL